MCAHDISYATRLQKSVLHPSFITPAFKKILTDIALYKIELWPFKFIEFGMCKILENLSEALRCTPGY